MGSMEAKAGFGTETSDLETEGHKSCSPGAVVYIYEGRISTYVDVTGDASLGKLQNQHRE